MAKQPIAIAADHAGYSLKVLLRDELVALGYEPLDLGTHDATTSVDYPDYGAALAGALKEGRCEKGVLICGTGIGISIAANRHPGVRAALCHDETSARLAREHNDANVLALGARLIGDEVARDCLRIFLKTEFGAGRHQPRVQKLG
jgi:ribose 5-phosphate isomerase B